MIVTTLSPRVIAMYVVLDELALTTIGSARYATLSPRDSLLCGTLARISCTRNLENVFQRGSINEIGSLTLSCAETTPGARRGASGGAGV